MAAELTTLLSSPSEMMMTTMFDDDNMTSAMPPAGPPPHVQAMKLANKVILSTILAFIMVAMGCVVTPSDFKQVLRIPISVLIGLLCQFVLFPLMSFCLALALSLTTPFALGVLVISCCPGGTVSNLFTFWTKGDVCLSICMTTISTVAAIGMMPLNLFIYSRRWTSKASVIPFTNIVISLVSIMIPVAIGMIIKWKKEHWTKYITVIGSIFGLLGIVINVILNGLINPAMFTASWKLWFAAAILPFLGIASGYFLAWILRRTPKHRRTIAFETGCQNVALALTVIVLTFDDSPMLFDTLTFPSLFGPFMMIDAVIVTAIYKLAAHFRGEEEVAERVDEEPEALKDGGNYSAVPTGHEVESNEKQ